MNLLFAATHPDRTAAIVLVGTFARVAWAPDYTFGTKPDAWHALLDRMEQGWGKGVLLSALTPSLANDAAAREWWGRFQRQACSPGAAVALLRMAYEIDARPILHTDARLRDDRNDWKRSVRRQTPLITCRTARHPSSIAMR